MFCARGCNECYHTLPSQGFLQLSSLAIAESPPLFQPKPKPKRNPEPESRMVVRKPELVVEGLGWVTTQW